VDAKAEPEQDKQKDAKLVEADDEAEETEEVEETDPVEDDASEEVFTVGTLVDSLNEYDEETALEFAPIVVDGVEFKITELVLDDEEEGKVIVNVVYDSPEKEDDKDIEDEEVESDVEESSPEDADQPEAEDASEEATDDGDDEVIESLKEMVRQKDALEEEVLDLKNQQVVSDAKMSELQEELTKYKTGFVRVSELASKATKLQKEVTQLQEQLGTKETTIKNLESKISTQTKLTESVSRSTNQVKDLQERLRRVVGEAESTEQELKEQVESTRATASKNAQIAKAYKQKYLEAVEHYIASKATMLGVTSRDIKAKLHEGYTLADVDAVCDTLLNAGRPAFGLGIATQAGTKVKLKESASVKNTTLYGSDSDLADLLEFAGLK
jgi:DNA repair ATPase RecN